MEPYIDGFVHPIPTNRLDSYRQLAEAAAVIWKEHGALEYREFVGDDLYLEGTRSFCDATVASDDCCVIFGWVAFSSRKSRDEVNTKVASDPRMHALVENSASGFDAAKMLYGGFKSLFSPED